MKIRKLNLLMYITSFINVYITLILFLYKLLKKKISPIVGAIILSVNAYYFIPFEGSDLYRYYHMFEYDNKALEVIFKQQNDIYLEYLVYIIKKIGISYNIIAFISCYIIYYYFFKSFHLVMKNKKIQQKKYLLIFITYFLLIPVTSYHGLRFYPAIAIFTYGIIYQYYNKNTIKSLLYILLSVMIHSSLILPVIIYLLVKYIFKEKDILNLNIFLYLMLGFGFFLSSGLLVNIIEKMSFIPWNIKKYIYEYISGAFGDNILNSKSFIAKIGFYIFYYLRIMIVIVIIKIISKRSTSVYNFLKIMLIIIGSLVNFSVLNERYLYSIVYIQFLLSTNEYINGRVKPRDYNILLLLLNLNSVVLFLMFIRTQHFNIIQSYLNILKYNLTSLLFDLLSTI